MNLARRSGTALALFGLAWLLRTPLEAHPVTHMLVQMPALVLAGALMVPPTAASSRSRWNDGGWAGLIVAVGTLVLWMLPRSIDAALAEPRVDLLKFVSLPLLAGVPLALGWARAHPLLRGFLQAKAVSMCGVLAFLYLHAPVRLCNGYLETAQRELGMAFVALALALAVAWVAPLVAPLPVSATRTTKRSTA